MSDERLREAERRWRETGSVEDEARYLLERVRVGDLTQDRVDLAKLVLGLPGANRRRVDEAFRAMLVELARRPELYLGGIDEPATWRSLETYVWGYCRALDLMQLPSPLEGWQWFVEGRFLINHPAWSWARILAHGLGGDRPAIEALPSLFDEFLVDRDRLGPDGLDARRTALIIERHGRDWYEPPSA